jgi:hypothetical protein
MTLALVLGLLVVAGPPLAAARVVAPPGNSEADQYFQTVPGSAGSHSPDSSRTPEDAVREGRLPAVTADVLEGAGTVGRGLADAIAMTAPLGTASGRGGVAGEEATSSAGGKGLGVLFPILLLGTVAAAAGFAVLRRRRTLSA